MIRGLYSAASGMVSAGEYQEVSADNLANANVTGYRQRGLYTETFARTLGSRLVGGAEDIVGARSEGMFHDFRQGPVQQTGDPFHFYLTEPDQFFTLAGPSGPVYTRNGSFRLAPGGRVVSEAGYALQGETGPITIPEEAGRVDITPEGNVVIDGENQGRIRAVRFLDPRQLTPAGPTLFAATPAAGLQPADARVIRGSREGANVAPADMMIKMIAGARYYDAAQRSLRTIAETLQLNTRPQG